MDEPKINVYPGFYVIRGATVDGVVLAASNLTDFDTIRSVEFVNEYENLYTMVCMRTKA